MKKLTIFRNCTKNKALFSSECCGNTIKESWNTKESKWTQHQIHKISEFPTLLAEPISPPSVTKLGISSIERNEAFKIDKTLSFTASAVLFWLLINLNSNTYRKNSNR